MGGRFRGRRCWWWGGLSHSSTRQQSPEVTLQVDVQEQEETPDLSLPSLVIKKPNWMIREMCLHDQTDTRGQLKRRTEAGQIMEGFPLELQSLLCSAEPCWDLDMWNVATDKGHKRKKKEKKVNVWSASHGLCP